MVVYIVSTGWDWRRAVTRWRNWDTDEMISRAILTANLPILVPPNFWTSQRASGSIVFWCRLGGVLGGGESGLERGSGSEFIVEREMWGMSHV